MLQPSLPEPVSQLETRQTLPVGGRPCRRTWVIPGQSERTAGAQGGALLVVRLLLFPSHLTLTFERGRGMVTVPLPARNMDVPASHLKQVQPIKGYQRTVERAV